MSMFVIKGLTGSACDSEREGASVWRLYPVQKTALCITSIYICVCVILCLYPAPLKKNVWILLESIYSNIILILYWPLLVQALRSSSFLLIGCPSLIEVSGQAFCAHKPELCTINWIAAPHRAWFWQRFVPVNILTENQENHIGTG